MSRIGRLPVDIPSGVQVDVNGFDVRVKGPKGELKRSFSQLIGIKMENNQLTSPAIRKTPQNAPCMVPPAP